MSQVRTLLAALLPADWPGRLALLDAADRLDRDRPDSLPALLAAWNHWRGTGELPSRPPSRDVIAALALVLGGVGPELRARPRQASEVTP